MQPNNDDYLSRFSQPVRTQVTSAVPHTPPANSSFSKPNGVQVNSAVLQERPPLNFGTGLKIGFSILMLIWVIEIISEWNSIENSKDQYYNPTQSSDDVTYEHAVCDPNTNIYDLSECQDRLFDDSIESRETNMIIEMVKVGSWALIWVSLARIMLFANLTSKVINYQTKSL